MTTLVVVRDAQGRVTSWNRACTEATGYTLAEVHGKYVWDFLVLPDEGESVQAAFQALLAGQGKQSTERFWVTRSGEMRWIRWTTAVFYTAAGQVAYVVDTGTDLTSLRQAQQERQESATQNAAILLMPSPYREHHDSYLAQYCRTGEKKIS